MARCRRARSDSQPSFRGRGRRGLTSGTEGALGLIRADEKFDQRPGFKCLDLRDLVDRQAITGALADKRRTIRLPIQMRQEYGRVRRADLLLDRRRLRDTQLTRAQRYRAPTKLL